MRLLFIAPHLSTGGLPQYLFKKIESLNSSQEVYCVEHSNHSNAFVVQRNKISNILGNRYTLLGENKNNPEVAAVIQKLKDIFGVS